MLEIAHNFNYKYTGKNASTRFVEINKKKHEYELVQLFEFNSDRKRMSIIVKDGDTYKMYIKGADIKIEERLSKD